MNRLSHSTALKIAAVRSVAQRRSYGHARQGYSKGKGFTLHG